VPWQPIYTLVDAELTKAAMHFKKRMDSEWLHPHLQNLAFLATNSGMRTAYSGMRTAFLVLSRADILVLSRADIMILVYCTPS